jgi:hypothetical protein
VNDAAGDPAAQASGTLVVQASRLSFVSTNNIVVARIGDGFEPLSHVTGNTI